nr:heat shock 70 kDa protein 14 isoform X4 [Vicugna pacos]XP_031526790.1 heat shock 70 kDa protein 14 isoform X4 [Vicugna pacos]
MRSLDLASQQLALRGKNRLAPGDRPEHTEFPHLQIGTLLPRSLLQLAFSQSAMATSGSSAGIRWSRQETRTLLSILGEAEYIQRLQTVHHNADVYQAVSKRMQQEGFRRTERQCRSKFKVLKALYLKAYVAHATSLGDPPHCPFYDTLDQLLRNQIVTDPDPDNLMEEAAWPKHCDQNLTASDTPGQEGTSILGAKRTQAADRSPALQTVKESDEDCQLRNSDQMQETSDLEDSWDESSGAGCSQGTPSYSSSHHLFRGAVAPCQSSPMTRLGVSGEPSPCTSTGRNTPGVASAPQPPVSSRVPFVSGGNRPLNSEPPPRWARRRRRSVARTIAAELAENRRLARELSKREEEKLDRLIAIGEVASAQQDIANELRRDAVVAVRRLATAVEEATGAFQLGLEKLLQRLISNTKS